MADLGGLVVTEDDGGTGGKEEPSGARWVEDQGAADNSVDEAAWRGLRDDRL